MAEVVLDGIEQVMANLNKELAKINGRCEAGLVSAALLIKGDAQRLTPVVTGNLRASAYVVSAKEMHAGSFVSSKLSDTKSHSETMAREADRCRRSWTPTVSVGFTAEYAYAVHENPRSGKTWMSMVSNRSEGYYSSSAGFSRVGQWKFLETAVRNNIHRILDIIARKARK